MRAYLAQQSSLGKSLLSLVKVDDVPDSLEVVGLDVLVLEVECVLPDIDTNDGGVS